MGWTSQRATFYTDDGKVDRKQEVLHLCNENSENGEWKVLKIANVGSTFYCAVQRTRPNGERYVFGEVVLTSTTSKDYFNFSYKTISEDCGPCEDNCPPSILNLLSPTNSEWANNWRKRCYENAEKARIKKQDPHSLKNLPLGAVVEFINPRTKETEQVRKTKHPMFKRPIWICVDKNVRYLQTQIDKLPYKVIK